MVLVVKRTISRQGHYFIMKKKSVSLFSYLLSLISQWDNELIILYKNIKNVKFFDSLSRIQMNDKNLKTKN